MKVRVAEGRVLRDPVTKTLYASGEERDVPETSVYWRRRLRDGDVVPVETAHSRAPRHAAKED